jgi:GNAT superfamily N-acetyltransferase
VVAVADVFAKGGAVLKMAMTWRQMQPGDLDAVLAIASEVHPLFPEARAIFADKLHLHAGGALILERAGRAAGYCFAHPWQGTAPPPLDTLLGVIPATADALYLHDLALLPEAHGAGAGTAAIGILLAQAASLHLERICLVAVNGSVPYWTRHGFVVADAAGLPAKLASYGSDARFMVRAV